MPRFSMAKTLGGKPTAEMEERREALSRLLQKNGEELRDDSRLAYQYIVNGGDAALVAHELLTINFLYKHTRYDAHCQTGLKQVADLAHQWYPNVPWSVIWTVVREYGVPAMKFFALAEAQTFPPAFDVMDIEPMPASSSCIPSTERTPASCTADTA